MFDDGWVSLELDEDLYPRDAVQGAAYVFLDRAYVFLERAGGARIRVRLKAKGSADGAVLAGEFENEALAQAYRRRIAADNRAFIEGVASRALSGAAGPPGLDDLLAMDIGPDTAFDDPLGIAMSWEEKYAKKKADKVDPSDPAAAHPRPRRRAPARCWPSPGPSRPPTGWRPYRRAPSPEKDQG